jgi:predicted transcriptional regulator
VTFAANESARPPRADDDVMPASPGREGLIVKAQRLHDLGKARDRLFRRAVMADSAMGIMLSLFLSELKAVPLTESTLSLVNMLEADQGQSVIESLIQAGLVVVTGANPDRRAVGLTPLGSARMRSFISDHPDI